MITEAEVRWLEQHTPRATFRDRAIHRLIAAYRAQRGGAEETPEGAELPRPRGDRRALGADGKPEDPMRPGGNAGSGRG